MVGRAQPCQVDRRAGTRRHHRHGRLAEVETGDGAAQLLDEVVVRRGRARVPGGRPVGPPAALTPPIHQARDGGRLAGHRDRARLVHAGDHHAGPGQVGRDGRLVRPDPDRGGPGPGHLPGQPGQRDGQRGGVGDRQRASDVRRGGLAHAVADKMVGLNGERGQQPAPGDGRRVQRGEGGGRGTRSRRPSDVAGGQARRVRRIRRVAEEQVPDRRRQVGGEQPQYLVECRREVGERRGQPAGRAGRYRPVAGEDERGPAARVSHAADQRWRRRVVGERPQAGADLVGCLADDHRSVPEYRPRAVQRVAEVGRAGVDAVE